jgi:seryl-tRNA synthetase
MGLDVNEIRVEKGGDP